ncbi:MAG TPA: D-alanine--D-alanine ligase [Mycobacteriales bacterium]|nr:D-alanine--D-alanine ligase [Mycobacteriales bacterium]
MTPGLEDPHVAVLAGGLTYEREVSLRSGRRVAEAIRALGAEATLLDADVDLLATLAAHRPDAVIVALHGSAGEDGALRGVLELVGMPYVGSTAAASRLAWDKPSAKALIRAAGLCTPDWVALTHSTFRELGSRPVLDGIVRTLGLPLMVKPAQGGSALGAHRVQVVEDLPAAMVGCFAYGDTVLIERLVAGVEVAVSVIDGPVGTASTASTGARALPVVEIVPSDAMFDYAARYTPGRTTYHVPARLDPVVAARVAELAERAHAVLGLRDLSRTDAIVTSDGTVWFLEVNVAPGMTETSMTPMAIRAAGLELGELCLNLVRRAAERGAR